MSLLQLAFATRAGNVTAGQLTAVSLVIGMIFMPFTQLIGILRSWQDANLAAQRIAQVAALSSDEKTETVFSAPTQSITFRNVTFKYPGRAGKPSLKNIDLTIPAGKTTAIVGASGAGKSTFIALILKLLSPSEGQIAAGGLDLATVPQSSWRHAVAGVLQEGVLFPASIKQNIILSEVCDESRLRRAISTSCLDDLVDDLPLGLETILGPEGTNLSGGQRQRVLLARAIYRETSVLVLDEATSALDAVTEAKVFENLKTTLPLVTRIISAHRLSTIRDADNICVLENGRLVGSGKHADLASTCPEYARLIHHQGERSAEILG
jgi:ATP-binding cassette subfamily B protein